MKKVKIFWKNFWPYILIHLFRIFPIKEKKVVFRSYHGTKYNDHPWYISEALKKKKQDIDIVWLVTEDVKRDPTVRMVKEWTPRAVYELATAHIWVDNVRKDPWTRKRKGQFYIQAWHGGTALKKIEKDAVDKLPNVYKYRALLDSKMADVFISCSHWNTELYKSCFWYEGEIAEIGAPRSDIFYQPFDTVFHKVYKYFNLSDDVKLLVYAPTFRNSENMSCYNIDFNRLVKSLHFRFSGDWKIIVRLHPNMANKQGLIEYSDFVLNGSTYPDINELIVASEFIITDYSSCMFDAMEAKKKVMLYATDIESYMDERGTYFTFNELPFTLTTNNDELNDAILGFDEKTFYSNVRLFMKQLGFVNDGYASERVANLIVEQLKGLT